MSGAPLVLLVDDDADLRASTEQALDLAGLSVKGLPDAESALERITAGIAAVGRIGKKPFISYSLMIRFNL